MRVFLKKQWPLIALGGLLVLVSFYLIRSGKQMIEGPLLDAIVKGEGLKLKDIHYTHNDPNKEMKWSVDALEVSFSEDKSFISFREFLLKLEPEDRPCFELKGKKGIIPERPERLISREIWKGVLKTDTGFSRNI